MRIIIIIINALKGANAQESRQQKEKKKKKNQGNWTKLVQWAILSFIHQNLFTMFSLHFGETSFRWGLVKNARPPPNFFFPSLLTKQHSFSFFSPIFSLNFSIHPISPPNKHTVRFTLKLTHSH